MNIVKSRINIPAKIASVVVAIVLWFHVTTNATFNYRVSLPVVYAGPSEGFMIAGNKPDAVLVSIRGTGRALFSFYLIRLIRPEHYYTLISLTGLPKGEHKVTIGNNNIILGTMVGLEIDRILKPENAVCSITIDKKMKSTVSVNVDSISGYIVEEGYVEAGKPTSDPEFVLIQGPEDVVKTLDKAKVTFLKSRSISPKDSVLKAHPDLPQFVTMEPEEVVIKFHIEQLISKNLTGVPLTLKGFPRRGRPKFEPDTLAVRVHGPRSVVSNLATDNILISIHYQMYLERIAHGDSLIKPKVTCPEGITLDNLIPDAIRFYVDSTKG
ncbi:hypothetical protein ACFL1R_07635 [Candidatus Latescibacterota bacterium]